MIEDLFDVIEHEVANNAMYTKELELEGSPEIVDLLSKVIQRKFNSFVIDKSRGDVGIKVLQVILRTGNRLHIKEVKDRIGYIIFPKVN